MFGPSVVLNPRGTVLLVRGVVECAFGGSSEGTLPCLTHFLLIT
jgi:hypothetical protein